MVTSMNHELRTPINAMENSLQLLKPFVAPGGLKWFKICATSNQFLLFLVQDTLDYALLEEGKFKLNFYSVDTIQLMLEIIMIISVHMSLKKNVILKHSIEAGVR